MGKKQKPAQEPEKTNVIRLLEQAGIPCKIHSYEGSGAVSGPEVAEALGENPNQVFKTLVTVGKPGCHYVFVLPVNRELSLKKAAKAVSEKSVSMLKARELLPLTGYVHGGCSPIGMKKAFPTVLDASALEWPVIFFSAGKIGLQAEVSPTDLQALLSCPAADLTE